MMTKQCLALPLVLSWLWLSDGVAATSVGSAASEQALPQGNNLQQPLPSDTDTRPDSPATEVNQLQPHSVSPDTRTKHGQQHCKSPEVIVASCEPAPGSALSAFPLVLNTIHPYRTTSS
jgi:hypothetical protein